MADEGAARERWRRIGDILGQVRELSSTERRAYLDRTCLGDTDLRTEVESLLEAEQEANSFLEIAAIDRELSRDVPLESTGQFDNRYRIIRRLGGGGMGEVFEAQQLLPVRRRVAIKLILVGMDTPQLIRRFEAERVAIARMSHSNIATVFDAGVTLKGRPFLVMQYVNGTPLTTFCDSHRLGIHERLELFCQVCDGVGHAHGRGVIHRDLKPSNILAMLEDGRPVAKIIDFGLAKAIGQRLTDDTMLTQLGQVIGTPAYMSPEQAEGANDEDLAPTTDIYSLGATLYELLVGVRPIESQEPDTAGVDGFRRQLLEVDPPPPSTRLRMIPLQRAETIARARCANLATLEEQLRGKLDRITMKALSKDRSMRHASAGELAIRIRCDLDVADRSNDNPESGAESEIDGSKPVAWLVVMHSAVPEDEPQIFRLSKPRTLIGRQVDSDDLELEDRGVGRHHAAVYLKQMVGSGKTDSYELVLRDLSSTNGTTVNDRRLTGDHILCDGDRIQIGRAILIFKRV